MFSRIKEAYYRKAHGPERAELILRVERELETLPRGVLTRQRAEWLWSLPSEAWTEAVEALRNQDSLLREREAAVQAITRKNRLLAMVEDRDRLSSEEAERLRQEAAKAVQEFERMKEVVRILEERVRGHTKAFSDRFDPIPRNG